MKMTKLKLTATTLIATASLAATFSGTAQAAIAGDTSDVDKVEIGESTVDVGSIHVSGRVGFNVPSMDDDTFIDFQGLQGILGTDANDVTTFTATTSSVDNHDSYGRFDFAKVGSQDVYFGEWSQTGSATAGDHTVYYGGTDATSAIPSSGSATYAVKGISDYASNGILTGTFTANFYGSAGTLSGSLTNSASSYTVDIGTAAVTSSGAIAGTAATASNATTTLASSGVVSGQFFGSNADALAGIVEFSSNQYDTAFGGTKN